jgi:phosphatidylserine decarboxylase
LFPVAPKVVRFIEGLFAINERVVLSGEWEHGFFSITPVGATNVGSIVVNFDKELITNQRQQPTEKCIEKAFSPKVYAKKGDEIAFFHMGSTVVLIFQCPEFKFQITNGQKVKLGNSFRKSDFFDCVRPTVGKCCGNFVCSSSKVE